MKKFTLKETLARAFGKGNNEEDPNQKIICQKVEKLLDEWVKRKGYCEEKTCDQVAEELHVYTPQLNYYCRKKFGKDFRSWRIDLRIEESKQLMYSDPVLSENELSTLTGFNDKSNFRKAFRKREGVTPFQWKAKHIRKIRK